MILQLTYHLERCPEGWKVQLFDLSPFAPKGGRRKARIATAYGATKKQALARMRLIKKAIDNEQQQQQPAAARNEAFGNGARRHERELQDHPDWHGADA